MNGEKNSASPSRKALPIASREDVADRLRDQLGRQQITQSAAHRRFRRLCIILHATRSYQPKSFLTARTSSTTKTTAHSKTVRAYRKISSYKMASSSSLQSNSSAIAAGASDRA